MVKHRGAFIGYVPNAGAFAHYTIYFVTFTHVIFLWEDLEIKDRKSLSELHSSAGRNKRDPIQETMFFKVHPLSELSFIYLSR